MRIGKWLLILLLAVIGSFYMYTNYGLLQSEEVTEVQIEKKDHEEDNYYIYVDDTKMKVKDENIWMLLDEEKRYDLTYEWYGEVTPYIKEINQTGDEDSIGGGH